MPTPTLLLIGGYAGCGKTELARVLARLMRWALLDKDTLTRPLLEALAQNVCGDADDRQSAQYMDLLRPLEYQCLLNTAFEIVRHKCSVVAVAPFLRELPSPQWTEDVQKTCAKHQARLAVVWVQNDRATMKARLAHRGESRDRWKLSHWDQYQATVNEDLRPACKFIEVDNQAGDQRALAVRAQDVARQLI